VLRRLGLSRLRTLEPGPPVIRSERAYPGELIHINSEAVALRSRCGHHATFCAHERRKHRKILQSPAILR
jgi:hypothetical protein